MTFFFPESETGYYEDERSFYDHDRELELAELEREQRFELEAEEAHERLWSGPFVPYVGDSPTKEATVDLIDPETGCTAAEMDEADRIPLRFLKIGDLDPTPSDSASQVTFPPEMSVGQTITARWGRAARSRKGVA